MAISNKTNTFYQYSYAMHIRKHYYLEVHLWVEAAFRLHSKYLRVPAKFVHRFLNVDTSKIIEHEDGVHYQKKKDDGWWSLYVFDSKEPYNSLVQAIEDAVGLLPEDKTTSQEDNRPQYQEIMLKYAGTQPTIEVALAKFLIMKIGDIHEDGIHQITPRLYRNLQWAVATLQAYPNKTLFIKDCIDIGSNELEFPEVLTLVEFDASILNDCLRNKLISTSL